MIWSNLNLWSKSGRVSQKTKEAKLLCLFYTGRNANILHKKFWILSLLTADDCSDPGTPPGASRSAGRLHVGEKVSYLCQAGLYLLGSAQRVCLENREWSGSPPRCQGAAVRVTVKTLNMYQFSITDNLSMRFHHYCNNLEVRNTESNF